jgi:purine-binding chemotaxis protein CheW
MVNTDTHEQLVIFSLGGEEFGLPIARVQEIVRYTEPRPLSSRSVWVRGVVELRGKTVAVCDLAARLGVPSDPSKIVVVETAAGVVGVAVDEVREVLTVVGTDLRRAGAAADPLVEAIADLDGRFVAVLDPGAILPVAALGAVA